MVDPVAFSIFGLEIYWYGLTYAIGFLVSYFFIMHFGKAIAKREILEDLFFYFMIFSVLGGRVFEIIFYDLSYYLAEPIKIFYVWEGGMSIHGGFFFGMITLWYLCRKYKVDYLKIWDLFSIPTALGLSFGRLANFVNQELVGKVTTSNLGIVFPLYDNQNRWPTTIFESVKNMATFQIILYLSFFKSLKPGILTAWFFILYDFGRFFINFLREPTVSLGFISMGQFLCLIFGFYGVWMLYKINKKN